MATRSGLVEMIISTAEEEIPEVGRRMALESVVSTLLSTAQGRAETWWWQECGGAISHRKLWSLGRRRKWGVGGKSQSQFPTCHGLQDRKGRG